MYRMKVFCLVLFFLTFIFSFSDFLLQAEYEPGSKSSEEHLLFDPDGNIETGLNISETASHQPYEKVTQAVTRPLSDAAAEKLFSRLEDFTKIKRDSDFAVRDQSSPVPRAGVKVEADFPPESELSPPDVKAPEGPLKVLRVAPEGAVDIAPHVSLTFNQPMVAVTSHSELAGEVPVKLTPRPAGRWRWMGTRTIIFEAEGGRLPMATKYSVEVLESARSISGNALEGQARYHFTTPPLRLVQKFPEGRGFARNAPIFIGFNQQIDVEGVLSYLSIRAGGEEIPFRHLSRKDIPEDFKDQVERLIDRAGEGRWLLVQSEQLLPAAEYITVSIRRGAPSAEGPVRSDTEKNFNFRTYDSLTLEKITCRGVRLNQIYLKGECPPNSMWIFRANNQIDSESFNPNLVTIEPSIPEVKISGVGYQIVILGETKPQTSYRVTFSRKLRDQFGQTLSGKNEFIANIGNAPPSFMMGHGHMRILDPSEDPALSLHTVNYQDVRLQLWRVDPEDYSEFIRHSNRYHRSDYDEWVEGMPGVLLEDTRVPTEASINETKETRIHLAQYLNEGKGHLIARVLPGATMLEAPKPPSHSPAEAHRLFWIQATDIGLDTWSDPEGLIVFSSSLRNGNPLEGVAIKVSGKESVTSIDGTARLSLADRRHTVIHASKGRDRALLPTNLHHSGRTPSAIFNIFDDRGVYRPGEEVHIKGWVRELTPIIGGDIDIPSRVNALTYTVRDARNNQIATGGSVINDLGGFDFSFKLPDTPHLGIATIQLGAGSYNHQHRFRIEEFRTPEFQIQASMNEGPFYSGDAIEVRANASYYAGGGLAGAPAEWSVHSQEANFTPPNLHNYSFGRSRPWFWPWAATRTESKTKVSFEGVTNFLGEHVIQASADAGPVPLPVTLHAQAAVTDVNRQRWAGSTSTLVHPASYYVGLRTDSYLSQSGQDLKVEFVVSNISGELIAGVPVKIVAERLRAGWGFQRDSDKILESVACRRTSTDGPASCTFTPEHGGSWRITAVLHDDEGRANFSSIRRWVGDRSVQAQSRIAKQELLLIPDKEEYRVGDVAKIMIQAPFAPAEGLLTFERFGIVEERRITFKEPLKTIEVPLREGYVPNLHVSVQLSGVAPRGGPDGEADPGLPPQPAFAGGRVNLSIPAVTRTLNVQAKPLSTSLAPGESTSVDILVQDINNRPVSNAEVAVIVVDEAILALSDYQMADPISVFYQNRPALVQNTHNRSFVVVDLPDTRQFTTSTASYRGGRSNRELSNFSGTAMERTLAATGIEAASDQLMSPEMAAAGSTDEAVHIRSDFNPLAGFFPGERTDRNGRATIKINLPDNLTRYRIMVVAADGPRRFGATESTMTARLPLMVRPSPPRFLNFGDKFELPVVLQNQTDGSMEVALAGRALNVDLKERGYFVEVPAGDRVEVRFPASTISAGSADFQLIATSSEFSDASSFTLPIWTPATSEAFATYGTVDEGAILHKVMASGDVWEQFGGLQIATSSTALQALTDAFIYLYDYPFRCSEQIASRIIAVSALRDALQAFNVPSLPAPEEISEQMERDINELSKLQTATGGFGLWRSDQRAWPYSSLHAIHALIRAKAKGYSVPAETLSRARDYMSNIDRHIPPIYSESARRTIKAYALYVRAVGDDYDTREVIDLLTKTELDDWSMESLGWLLYVLAATPQDFLVTEIVGFLHNRVHETASTAEFFHSVTEEDRHVLFHSSRRADAVVLESLMKARPDSDLIAKLVRGLLAHRKKGRWGSTQDNGFVLLALDGYFNKYEAQSPDFIARAWLGERYAGEHAFKGRSTETHQIEVPMSFIAETKGPQNLLLKKEGDGRMYYRLGMRYAPKSLQLDAADHGFHVERSYKALGDKSDVKKLGDGSWKIKAGANIEVTVKMVAPGRRYHVALIDPLPAGLEILNPALNVTEALPETERERAFWWWHRPWYEHQNLRDERAEAFSSLLHGGVYEYTYYARATTPGEFVVPPARAEEMYAPETFGRSGTERVIVWD